jgi:molybdate transport system substrate-binding protein
MKCQFRRLLAVAAALCVTLLASPAGAQGAKRPPLLVFAAASLTDVLGTLAKSFEQHGGVPVRLSFAASSVLARQIEAGSKADVFLCADQEWMDYLQQRNLVASSSRRDLAGNQLVLIAPANSKVAIEIAPGFPLLAALGGGRLSTGDPDTVPVGRYARSALVALGVWEQVRDRLAPADNVRSALMFVSRGEAPLGIVYATDALLEPRVRIVATFPANTHAPITYAGAVTIRSNNDAVSFLEFLSKPESLDTWRRFGFLEPRK